MRYPAPIVSGAGGPILRSRARSWVLAVSLLPMLTFMGHWPSSIGIPGTNLYLTVPLAIQAAEPEAGEAHDHTQHCHGDAASCSDVPVLASTSFALMDESLLLAVAAGLLLLVTGNWWLPQRGWSLAPDRRPPRLASVV